MEPVTVRRKSCLLRLRENCPFRKLRRQTYALSSAASSPIGSHWNSSDPSTDNRPISTVYGSQPLPPLSNARSVNQSQAVVDIHMEEDPQNQHNQNQNHQNRNQNQQNVVWDRMDLGDDIDPETGERAQD